MTSLFILCQTLHI